MSDKTEDETKEPIQQAPHPRLPQDFHLQFEVLLCRNTHLFSEVIALFWRKSKRVCFFNRVVSVLWRSFDRLSSLSTHSRGNMSQPFWRLLRPGAELTKSIRMIRSALLSTNVEIAMIHPHHILTVQHCGNHHLGLDNAERNMDSEDLPILFEHLWTTCLFAKKIQNPQKISTQWIPTKSSNKK